MPYYTLSYFSFGAWCVIHEVYTTNLSCNSFMFGVNFSLWAVPGSSSCLSRTYHRPNVKSCRNVISYSKTTLKLSSVVLCNFYRAVSITVSKHQKYKTTKHTYLIMCSDTLLSIISSFVVSLNLGSLTFWYLSHGGRNWCHFHTQVCLVNVNFSQFAAHQEFLPSTWHDPAWREDLAKKVAA